MSIQSSLQPQLVFRHNKKNSLDTKHYLAALNKPLYRQHFAANNLDIADDLAALNKPLYRQYFAANNLDIAHNLAARDKAPDIKHFAANNLAITDNLNGPILACEPMLACKPMLACNLQCQDSRNRLIIARPLKELWAHVRSRKLPSLRLVARAIKALALSIFRWHLCDYILIPVANSIFHNQKGRIEMRTRENLKKDYPYLFQSALEYEFIPSLSLTITQIRTMKQINAQSLVELCKLCGDIALTSKEKGNTLSNLFKSKHLKLLAK
ncbi:MAG: hypothetical protein LLG04_18260 [Parachlamydia sp.]|nr:hypothetical protein [Parachlamydia sp.]